MINAFKRLIFKLRMNQFQEMVYCNFRKEIESNIQYFVVTSQYTRQQGKTSVMLKLSHDTGIPLYVSLNENIDGIKKMIKDYGFHRAKIFTKDDLTIHSLGSKMKLLIDEPANKDDLLKYPELILYGFVYQSEDDNALLNQAGKKHLITK